ncbi:SHOCT domain-containing protein [Streptomyces sp. NBC_00102]|uniref:SHOCT domain-containing protein n=1 Tax=Streptomyces sp. NBC_00102 TaxID=2975652 RepID=UPI002251A8C5|nr:SHOCT domain-containing protein [Streptomyces sp. NBC_00102]MCX5402118.1 SHOCT domain-containing protein [Streptomyces sp. NBC_00102]
MPRRMGRPGLLGTIARTAVITGTARTVSNHMQPRADERYVEQAPPQTYAAPAAPDRVAQLTALADLKSQGLLTDEEFATEKAKILNA